MWLCWRSFILSWPRRVLEDYAVLYCGPAVFKIGRLLLVAMMCCPIPENSEFHIACQRNNVIGLLALTVRLTCRCVHFFACAFFRVKEESAASPDDVTTFYSSRGVSEQASFDNRLPYYYWELKLSLNTGSSKCLRGSILFVLFFFDICFSWGGISWSQAKTFTPCITAYLLLLRPDHLHNCRLWYAANIMCLSFTSPELIGVFVCRRHCCSIFGRAGMVFHRSIA